MIENEFNIPLNMIIDEYQLEKVYVPENIDDIKVTCAEVNRPGLQIVGFFDYFDSNRIQIIGKVEVT